MGVWDGSCLLDDGALIPFALDLTEPLEDYDSCARGLGSFTLDGTDHVDHQATLCTIDAGTGPKPVSASISAPPYSLSLGLDSCDLNEEGQPTRKGTLTITRGKSD